MLLIVCKVFILMTVIGAICNAGVKFQSKSGNEPTTVVVLSELFGTVCAPANIGHKRVAEKIKVISRFMALLSINVVRNNRILTEVGKVDIPKDSSIWCGF